MFDLAVFANPARLKREFLAVTDIAPQEMPHELEREFNQIREESPDVLMTGSFWMDFVRTYRGLLTGLAGRGEVLVTTRAAEVVVVHHRHRGVRARGGQVPDEVFSLVQEDDVGVDL